MFQRPTETYRANTEVDALEVLRAVHVQAVVHHAALLARLHRARAERVPRRLDMVRNPVVDCLVVLGGVLDVLVHLRRVVHVAGLVPRAHVDADRQPVRVDLLRSPDVDVAARRGGVGVEARVVRRKLTAEGCERNGT